MKTTFRCWDDLEERPDRPSVIEDVRDASSAAEAFAYEMDDDACESVDVAVETVSAAGTVIETRVFAVRREVRYHAMLNKKRTESLLEEMKAASEAELDVHCASESAQREAKHV